MKSGPAPAAVLLLALTAGCGAEAPAPVAARSYADPGVVIGSGHEMRYGIMPVADIPASVLKSYGLTGSAGGLLVNVSVLQRDAAGRTSVGVEAVVTGSMRRLTGQDLRLEFRSIRTGEVVSYLALAPMHDGEPVTFLLEARPARSPAGMTAKVTRQFERTRS